MKKAIGLVLVAVAVFAVFGRATCQRAPEGVSVKEVMKIKDHVFYHNVGITWADGKYYTVNGGNEGWGQVNCYNAKGKFLDSWTVEIDGRGIYWHPDDEALYIKDFGTNLFSFDPEDGEADLDLEDVFIEDNSSPAMSPDGEYLYELSEGEVRVLDSYMGDEEETVSLARGGDEHGYNYALAVSDKYFFTWDEGGQVWIHDLEGNYVDKFMLPRDGFGFSLTWTNGMLWIAEDADGTDVGADGYWHGYKITGLQ